MADNIGTITVAIEAQTAELKSGLESAERAVKQSSKEMEESVENFATRAEKSWTEFASKLGVIQQVAGIAKNAMQALTDSAAVLGDESASSAEKYNSILNTIRDSGIPVLSEAVSIGQNLRDVLDGTAAELAKVAKEMERIEEMNKRAEFLKGVVMTNDGLRTQLELMKLANQAEENRAKGVSDVTERFNIQRLTLEKGFAKQMQDLEDQMRANKVSNREQVNKLRELRGLQVDILDELDKKEKRAHEQFMKQQEEKRRKEEELAKQKLLNESKINDALETTKNLEIEIAEDAGGGTVGAQTAIGGFTIATGSSEPKKQTSLLQKIADSNQEVADALKKNGTSSEIIVAQ